MNRILLAACVLLAIVALVFLNQGMKRSSTVDVDDDDQKAQQSQQTQQAPKPAAPKPGAPIADPLPSEETVGDPTKAAHHVQVGWAYDEANQAHPEVLSGPLGVIRDTVKSNGGAASAVIVNIDVPASERSPAGQGVAAPGVFVDGKPVLGADVFDGHQTAPQIQAALKAALGGK